MEMEGRKRWRLEEEEAKTFELGSKEVNIFNKEFLQTAAWWKLRGASEKES